MKTADILWSDIARAAREMTGKGLGPHGWDDEDEAMRQSGHDDLTTWVADLEDRVGYDVGSMRAAVLAYIAWDDRDAFTGLEDAVLASALVEIYAAVAHDSEAAGEVMDRFDAVRTEAQCWREAEYDMRKVAAARLSREVTAEFGEEAATELREDLPYLNPRLVARPWHNDTCAKLVATLANDAEVWVWLERRHHEDREEYGDERFHVMGYRDADAACAGDAIFSESFDEPGDIDATVTDAIKAVQA